MGLREILEANRRKRAEARKEQESLAVKEEQEKNKLEETLKANRAIKVAQEKAKLQGKAITKEEPMKFEEILEEIKSGNILTIKTAVPSGLSSLQAYEYIVDNRINNTYRKNNTFNDAMNGILDSVINDYIDESKVVSLVTRNVIMNSDLGNRMSLVVKNDASKNDLKRAEDILLDRLAETLVRRADDVVVEIMRPDRAGESERTGKPAKELWSYFASVKSFLKTIEVFGFDVKDKLQEMDKSYVYDFLGNATLVGEGFTKHQKTRK